MNGTLSGPGGTLPPRPPLSGDPFPPPALPDWSVSFHARLDSTNLEAQRRLAAGEAGKLLILAESQTDGQCRHDRLWESPPGKGLWASFILPVSAPLEILPQSTLVLAVAVREGIEQATGVRLGVKWPNDLLGNGRKCCGLLVETAGEPASGRATPLILGAGVNCNQTVDDFPPYLREAATSLSLLAGGKTFGRAGLLASVARAIDVWFGRWEREGFSPVREAWLARNCTLGRTVVLPGGYGHALATARDLDLSGALLAEAEDGAPLRLDSGEIRFPETVAP